MANVTSFPPNLRCPACGTKLRPATRSEINRGLRSTNATVRQAFEHAVQGNMGRKVVDGASLAAWQDADTPEGSWVMLCDGCGNVTVHMREAQLG